MVEKQLDGRGGKADEGKSGREEKSAAKLPRPSATVEGQLGAGDRLQISGPKVVVTLSSGYGGVRVVGFPRHVGLHRERSAAGETMY